MPGAARQQVTLFCLPKIQVTKQKGTPPRRPCGLPSVFRKDRALPHKGIPTFYPLKRMKDRIRNSRIALGQPQPTAPDLFGNPRRCRGGFKTVLWAEPVFLVPSPAGRAADRDGFLLAVTCAKHRAVRRGRPLRVLVPFLGRLKKGTSPPGYPRHPNNRKAHQNVITNGHIHPKNGN
jgi:hypothetical protein